MKKVDGITFHPTNNQTLPTSIPISTKQTFSTQSTRFFEFFNTIMSQRGVTVYYKIKSSITVMNLCHRVFHFLQENHLLINNKQIQDNRPMDVAIIYRGHNKHSNKNTL